MPAQLSAQALSADVLIYEDLPAYGPELCKILEKKVTDTSFDVRNPNDTSSGTQGRDLEMKFFPARHTAVGFDFSNNALSDGAYTTCGRNKHTLGSQLCVAMVVR